MLSESVWTLSSVLSSLPAVSHINQPLCAHTLWQLSVELAFLEPLWGTQFWDPKMCSPTPYVRLQLPSGLEQLRESSAVYLPIFPVRCCP